MTSAANAHQVSDLDVASRLRTAVTRLNRRLRQQSLGGISPAQASTLAITARLENPTLGELARAEQIQPPTMTRLIAGMEEAGLVERCADDRDRRIVRVAVTQKGRGELKRIRTMKNEYLMTRLEAMDEVDREAASRLVTLLERLGDER